MFKETEEKLDEFCEKELMEKYNLSDLESFQEDVTCFATYFNQTEELYKKYENVFIEIIEENVGENAFNYCSSNKGVSSMDELIQLIVWEGLYYIFRYAIDNEYYKKYTKKCCLCGKEEKINEKEEIPDNWLINENPVAVIKFDENEQILFCENCKREELRIECSKCGNEGYKEDYETLPENWKERKSEEYFCGECYDEIEKEENN